MTIKGGKVTGTVQTTDCGTWKVTGTYKKKKLNVKATNQENNGCCEWFTYTGTFNKRRRWVPALGLTVPSAVAPVLGQCLHVNKSADASYRTDVEK